MTDYTLAPAVRRPSPLVALVRYWPLSLLIVVVFTVLGGGVGLARPVAYTGEARMLVGSSSLSAQATPGYVQATIELTETYARLVTSDGLRKQVAAELGAGMAGVQTVSASPIPDSAILRIEVNASSPAAATRGATAVTVVLTNVVNQVRNTQSPDALLKAVGQAQDAEQKASDASTAATARAQSDPTAANKAAANTALQALTLAQLKVTAASQSYQLAYTGDSSDGNAVTPIQGAQVTSNTRTSAVEKYGLVGFGLGLVLALGLTSYRAGRAASRLRTAGVAGSGGRANVVALSGDEAAAAEDARRLAVLLRERDGRGGPGDDGPANGTVTRNGRVDGSGAVNGTVNGTGTGGVTRNGGVDGNESGAAHPGADDRTARPGRDSDRRARAAATPAADESSDEDQRDDGRDGAAAAGPGDEGAGPATPGRRPTPAPSGFFLRR